MRLVLLGFNFLSHFCNFSMLLLRLTGACCTACETAPSPCTRLQALVRLRRSHITATYDFAAVIVSSSVIDACFCTFHIYTRMGVGLATCLLKRPRTWQQHCMPCTSMTAWIMFMQTKAVKQHNLATIKQKMQSRKLMLHCLSA